MFFDREFVSNLGAKSLSKNPEITKERADAAWKVASKKQRDEVLKLADVNYGVAYRVRHVGAVTVKMAIAYSQALNVDPYYLICVHNDKQVFTYEAAKKLLIEYKYKKQIQEFEKRYKKSHKNDLPGDDANEKVPPVKKTAEELAKDLTPQQAIQTLSDGDLMALLLALLAKARAGKPQAISELTQITEILIR